MKKIIFLFFALAPYLMLAQQMTLTGLVKDAASGHPVPGALVGVKKTFIATVANDDGVFRLTAPKTSVITISRAGYKTATMAMASFGGKSETILLEPQEQSTKILVLENAPYEILKEVIETSGARFNKPVELNAYYKEFVRRDGKYVGFSDGMLDYHFFSERKKNKSELVVHENRAIELFNRNEAIFDASAIFNLQNAVTGNYEFSFIEAALLQSRHYKKYDFTLTTTKNQTGLAWNTIEFTPKAGSKGLYKGYFNYDPQTNLVMDYAIYSVLPGDEHTIDGTLLKLALQEVRIRTSFKMMGANYVLSCNSRFSKVKIWDKKHAPEVIESKSDLLVTNFSKEDFTYDKRAVYKGKRLFKIGNTYKEKFWLIYHSIVLTDAEATIINDLEKLVPDKK